MNKLTKLLSVLVITGAVGAGTAALAACSSNSAHTHTPVEHAAKDPTCTENGNKLYYTCDSDECADKYFSDEACSTETTLDAVTIAATGHSYEYADNEDGTHKITCEHDDYTATYEAHADEDEDGKCDKCGVTLPLTFGWKSGTYQDRSNGYILTIDVDTKKISITTDYEYTIIEETTYTVGDESVTCTANETTYTITYDRGDDVYTVKFSSGYGDYKYVCVPEVEDYGLSLSAFDGVYNVSLTVGDYTISKISVVSDSYVMLLTVANEGETETFTLSVDLYSVDGYNRIGGCAYEISAYVYIEATAVADSAPTALKVSYGEDPNDLDEAEITKSDETVSAIPDISSLSLTNGVYKGTTADETEYTVKISYYLYINGSYCTLVGGNATDGYRFAGYDSEYNPCDYVLKITQADAANEVEYSLDLYKSDGSTLLCKCTAYVPTYTALPTDGNEFTADGVFDEDNYVYIYKVATSGWYTITANNSGAGSWDNLNVCYNFTSPDAMNYGDSKYIPAQNGSATVYLTADTYISLSSLYIEGSYVAPTLTVAAAEAPKGTTADDPVTVQNGEATYDGDISATGSYYFSFTSENGGNYVISANGGEYYSYITFTVNDDDETIYGYGCDKTTCTITLQANATVSIVANISGWYNPEYITVYVVEDYLTGATTLTFTDNAATISASGNYVATVDGATVTGVKFSSDASFTVCVTGGQIQTAKQSEGSGAYTLTLDKGDLAKGLHVVITESNSVSVTQEVWSGFDAGLQGTYTYSNKGYDETITITVTLGKDTVTYAATSSTNGALTEKVGELTLYEVAGEYTVWGLEYNGDTFKLTITPGGYKVTFSDQLQGGFGTYVVYNDYNFTGFDSGALGTYTGEFEFYGSTLSVSLTLGENGALTYDFNGYGEQTLTVVDVSDNQYVAIDSYKEEIVFTVNDTSGTYTVYIVSNDANNAAHDVTCYK